MNETPKTKKVGRPKGSTSFTRVQLSDLVEIFGLDAPYVYLRSGSRMSALRPVPPPPFLKKRFVLGWRSRGGALFHSVTERQN